MMTPEEMRELVEACTYKPGWEIVFHEDNQRPWIQLEVAQIDLRLSDIGEYYQQETFWKSGKRYLSEHMCRQEVVGAVFGLIKDAEMHEIHEAFRYKGKSIYNPHLDPDKLAELATWKENFNFRKNAMSMEESE